MKTEEMQKHNFGRRVLGSFLKDMMIGLSLQGSINSLELVKQKDREEEIECSRHLKFPPREWSSSSV